MQALRFLYSIGAPSGLVIVRMISTFLIRKKIQNNFTGENRMKPVSQCSMRSKIKSIKSHRTCAKELRSISSPEGVVLRLVDQFSFFYSNFNQFRSTQIETLFT